MARDTFPAPHDWKEGRRLRAWALTQEGWPQRTIAAALGVTEGAVSQWLTQAREGGVAALRRRTWPGAPPKLSAAQRAAVPALLARGPAPFGFRGDVWTGPRVVWLIASRFGVRYHRSHVSRLLRTLDWTPQQPLQRATQRDEAAIRRWWAEPWPRLKRGRRERGYPGLGGRVRLFPVARARAHRRPPRADPGPARAADPRPPVRHRRRHACRPAAAAHAHRRPARPGRGALPPAPAGPPAGRLLVLWKGAPIHRAQPVTAFLAAGAAARLRLVQLPGYAPDRNPLDQGVWHALKHGELGNVCCADLGHRRRELPAGAKRLRRRPQVIRGCIQHAGYRY